MYLDGERRLRDIKRTRRWSSAAEFVLNQDYFQVFFGTNADI